MTNADKIKSTFENKEAVEELSDFAIGINQEVSNIALGLAIKALKKQIPKKPVRLLRSGAGYDYKDYACPMCTRFLGYEPEIESVLSQRQTPYRYCNDCGQKLDWSEDK